MTLKSCSLLESRTLNAHVTSDPGLSPIRSKGRVEQPEPAAQVLLDRQLVLQLRLQLQLLGVVAALVLAGRHERPERAALVAVDQVDGELSAFEAEDGGEQLLAETLLLESLRDRVHRGHLVLEVRVADDDPAEAEAVLAALELRAGLLRDALEQLLDVLRRALELSRGERLEADR